MIETIEKPSPHLYQRVVTCNGEVIFNAKNVAHTSPVFHQKIRRLFLKYPFFQFDGISHDITINQVGELMSVLVNVSRHDSAANTAKNLWAHIINTLRSKGATVDFNETNVVDSGDKINFFMGSNFLLKLR
ncbi:hypothetical protein [Teredinibacter purpureus]|uniref:hypothetical protein n=1 Tax=Teredinibacter purpureus TaxID=2731756 RepID=UPI0005F789C4|nr:hypothetical protein [Teredinibacter purpureus]